HGNDRAGPDGEDGARDPAGAFGPGGRRPSGRRTRSRGPGPGRHLLPRPTDGPTARTRRVCADAHLRRAPGAARHEPRNGEGHRRVARGTDRGPYGRRRAVSKQIIEAFLNEMKGRYEQQIDAVALPDGTLEYVKELAEEGDTDTL